jgi:hypothetical protein
MTTAPQKAQTFIDEMRLRLPVHLRYVEERFREAGWFDPNLPCAVKEIKLGTLSEEYRIIIQLPVARKDIPLEMMELATEIEDELDSRGYPVGIILRPDYALTLASLQ